MDFNFKKILMSCIAVTMTGFVNVSDGKVHSHKHHHHEQQYVYYKDQKFPVHPYEETKVNHKVTKKKVTVKKYQHPHHPHHVHVKKSRVVREYHPPPAIAAPVHISPVKYKDVVFKDQVKVTRPYETSGKWLPILNLSLYGGAAFTRNINEPAVHVTEIEVNQYQAHLRTIWNPIWGAGINYPFDNVFGQPFNISIGLSGYWINPGRVEGIEYPFANIGKFQRLNYQFQTQSKALFAESRFAYNWIDWQPYALVGLGCSWNILNDFTQAPIKSPLDPAPVLLHFNNHTNAAFAYELGLGVQRELYFDVAHGISYIASLDYRYFNLGKGELGLAPEQTTNSRLYINNMSTQGMLVTLGATFY